MRERTPFPANLLSQLPNLKLLLTTGMRNAAIDLPAAKENGIIVTGTKNSRDKPQRRRPDSTTQHTVALILGIVRNLAADDQGVQEGLWQTSLATSLAGKTFATVGLGRLGGTTAKIMWESFGMRVISWSTSLTQEAADQKAKELGLPTEDEEGEKTFKVVSKEQLFKQADVLSVHYVLSERSRGIVGANDLALMKKTAFLVNSSRGPLVDEEALLDILEKGAIQGAAVDVFELEPLPADSRWRNKHWGKDGRSKVLLTPHMGYVEEETLGAWYKEQVEILKIWSKGDELPNVLT
jgi:lactate dehydrogenase-like 2-hydroxyacid dehydrogenase